MHMLFILKEPVLLMTVSQIQTGDPFAFLYPHQFIALKTYRRDGNAVATTVWFAHDEQGKIYITTNRNAGKIKRVRNNGRVTMMPSGRTGELLGEQEVEGRAHEAMEGERAHARAVLEQKYGEAFTRIAGPDTLERTYIIINPVTTA